MQSKKSEKAMLQSFANDYIHLYFKGYDYEFMIKLVETMLEQLKSEAENDAGGTVRDILGRRVAAS